MISTAQVWKSLRRQPLKWLVYFLIALIALALESGGEFLSMIGVSNPNNAAVIPSMFYQRFATAGYREPRPHFVRLVVMSPTYDPQSVFGDVCEKREFEAALIKKLREISPSVIVLDFWYPPQSCKTGEDAQKSKALSNAITEASASVPIVVGLGTHTKHQFQLAQDPDLPGLIKAHFTSKDQILDEHASFGDKNISYGLARINSDTRRIPIYWSVYANKQAVLSRSKSLRLSSLAFTAASLRDSSIPHVLAKINEADEHPFTSFISESDFQTVRAIDLLCGHELGAEEDWRKCTAPDLREDQRFRQLKGGQIILIAQNSDQDNHQSVIGEVPGYVLQANYIEALLDDRCFRPIFPLLEIFFTLLGVVVIIFIFEISPKPLAAFDIACGFVILVAGVCNVLEMYFGRFIGFWIPLLPIPLVELGFTWRRRSAPETANSTNRSEPAKVG